MCLLHRLRAVLVGVAILLLSLLPASVSRGQEIKVALSSPGGVQSIYWYAHEGGFFKKQGLDATFVRVRGSSRGLAVIISGGVQFLADTLAGTINADLSGGGLVVALAPIDKLPHIFDVSPDIKRPQDLIGKRLAISTFGGESHYAVLSALKVLGIPREKVALLQVGTQTDRLAALLSKQVAGATFTPPANLKAESEGLRRMVDLSKSDTPYYSGSISVRRAFLDEHPETIKAFIRTYADAVRSYKNNPQAAKKALRTYTKISDLKLLNYAYEFYSRIYRDNPAPQCSTVKKFLAAVRDIMPRTKNLSHPCSVVAESLY